MIEITKNGKTTVKIEESFGGLTSNMSKLLVNASKHIDKDKIEKAFDTIFKVNFGEEKLVEGINIKNVLDKFSKGYKKLLSVLSLRSFKDPKVKELLKDPEVKKIIIKDGKITSKK